MCQRDHGLTLGRFQRRQQTQHGWPRFARHDRRFAVATHAVIATPLVTRPRSITAFSFSVIGFPLADIGFPFSVIARNEAIHVSLRQHGWPFGLRGPPLFGVGVQLAAFFKIRPAEGLQRVHGGQALGAACAPQGVNLVAQLRHQHRGRLLAVVAHAAPAPADVQRAACRQQGFEHQLAIVVAARAVAGAAHSGQTQQVEVGSGAAAWVVAVVHAQQTDHLERDCPHRHEGAKGHASGPKALLELGHFERLQPGRAGHRQRHALGKIGLVGGAGPVAESLVQGR